MVGKKKFLNAGKKGKGPALMSADDYLADGVEHEEGGEKWRAGDAAKSLRFFDRAIASYDEGLSKFPDSFDLAFNKARIQYDITQHPHLLEERNESIEELLTVALDSSRAALSLRQDSDDASFNLAQVLTSLAEAMTDSLHPSANATEEAFRLLEESAELFQRTLTSQEFKLSEIEASQDADMEDAPESEPAGDTTPHVRNGSDSKVQLSNKQETSEEWVEVIEPVTNDTLLDTAISQLATFTTICSLIATDEGRGIAWIEEYTSSLLKYKIPTYAQDTDRQGEVAFQKAKFLCALAEASFRTHRIDFGTYARAIEEAYTDISALINTLESPEVAVTKAEAYISFNSAVKNSHVPSNADVATILRWKALTMALDHLTAATKVPGLDREEASKIHLLRGDTEMLRYQMAGDGYELAKRSELTLAKNAATYYSGAFELSGDFKLKDEARLKRAIAKRFLPLEAGETRRLLGEALKNEHPRLLGVVEEAVVDGLVTTEWLKGEGVVIADVMP